jgi:hypothetical protein
MKKSTKMRFYEKVHVSPDAGCLVWTSAHNGVGYGRLRVDGRYVYAHRFAYELLAGPIPNGLTIDHLCRNPGCVNVDHLEPVTMRENILRSEGVSARQARQTHCTSGHPLSGDNLYTTPAGGRRCRACRRDRLAEFRYRRRTRRVAAQGSAGPQDNASPAELPHGGAR